MNKVIFLSVIMVLAAGVLFAQANVFPSIGSVGIGTTTPWEKLDVAGNGYFTGRIELVKARGNVSRLTIYADDLNGGMIGYYGNPSSPNAPLRLGTGDPPTERMRITQAGNVGIGTTNPLYRLHVTAPVDAWKARFSSPDGTGYIDIGPANAGWAHIYTDRPNFIFNVPVYSIGNAFSSYTGDLALQTGGITRISIKNTNGNVGIGTTNPQSTLAVNGTITAKEVVVTLSGWSDYVLKPDYHLKPLSEVEKYITANNHLLDIPAEKEVVRQGVSLGEMQGKLLAKVEELTLYLIAQDKKLTGQHAQLEVLAQENRELKRQVEALLRD